MRTEAVYAQHSLVEVSRKERIEIFEDLKAIIADYNFDWLAETAGVSPQTLYYWVNGRTRKPRLDTITKVASAVGYKLKLVRRRSASLH